MLEARIYHLDNSEYSASLPKDDFNNDFDTIHNNTTPCNYLTFDGEGINLIDNDLKFYETDDFAGYTLPYASDTDCNIAEDYETASLFINTGAIKDNYPERLTIQFYGNCCSKIDIVYYGANGVAAKTETINVTDKFLTIALEREYYKICIHFTKTVYSNQYVRIESIIFGTINVLNQFTSHNLLEEINVLSDDLPINQFEITVVNPDPDNIVFSKKDPLAVFSNGRYYGSFYIIDALRSGKYLYDIKAQNSLCLFEDDLTDWETSAYGEISVFDILLNIKSRTGVQIDCEYGLQSKNIDGFHKDNTYRAALCEIGYCLGQMIDGSRSSGVTFKSIPTSVSSTITNDDRRIIGKAIFKKNDMISGAEINYNRIYPLDVSENELQKKSISGNIGDKVIISFDKPTTIIKNGFATVSTGFETISETLCTYKIQLTSPNATIVYVERPMLSHQVTLTNSAADAGNVKKYENFLTRAYDDTTFKARNQNILKHIKSRGTVSAKIRLRNERIGDLIKIETAWDGFVTGIITKMNITFGYEDIADIEVLEWSS